MGNNLKRIRLYRVPQIDKISKRDLAILKFLLRAIKAYENRLSRKLRRRLPNIKVLRMTIEYTIEQNKMYDEIQKN